MDDKELTPAQRTALKLDTIACAAAESFIDAYYQTIKTDRSSLAGFYCAPSIAADGITSPQISWNGESYVDGAALQQLMQNLGYMHFKVETLDANVLNPRSIPASELPGGSGSEDEDLERRMSIQIVCAGSIRLGEQLKGPLREFAESFVLVPNLGKLAIVEGQKRHIDFKAGWDKQWLIQTQNFTFTEWSKDEAGEAIKDAEGRVIGGSGKMGSTTEQTKPVFGRNTRGPANAFAAAGLLGKGKGKAFG